ncbi:MAG: dihydrodipicolinate synthase family protein, partial [Planctomycetaceae bacterium]|nr:dihydrodipicolinate synthase family protein [Planctomycetaceae bacterium]
IRMIQAVRPNRPEFSFLTGWDAALMPMLLIGCDGGTNASSGVVPEVTRKLYDLTLSAQLDQARKIQYDLVTLFDTMIYQAEFPDGFRAAVDLRGFQMGRGRQPLSDEQLKDLSTLSNSLQCLLSEHGFTDQPVGGCPPRKGSDQGSCGVGHAPEEVSEIVRSVVSELKRRGLVN